jgi:hypothetical protein
MQSTLAQREAAGGRKDTVMRKNRRHVKRFSRFKFGATGIVALIVTSFIWLMIYWMLDAQCTSIMREIGKAENQVKLLDAEYGREDAKWNAMKTRERLDEKITRFGLAMQSPQPDQVIRMMANGKPAPGQMAVARAQARARTGNMALAAPRGKRQTRR